MEDTSIPADINMVTFTVAKGKSMQEISMPSTATVLELKGKIEEILQISPPMQKLIFKGILKDDATLEASNVKNGVKIILMASSVDDIIKVVSTPKPEEKKEEVEVPLIIALSTLTEHQKVISKGKPEDVEPGILNMRAQLPPGRSIKNLVNQANQRTNLTFKDELEQVWIGTKERTQKVPYSSVRAVVSEPIQGFEEYHMLALQLGPTEKSRYWLYWVPQQYTEIIKDTILGQFRYF